MRISRLPSGNYRAQIQVNGQRMSFTAATVEECEAWYNARKSCKSKASREYAIITEQIIEQQNTKRKNKCNSNIIVKKSDFKKLRIPKTVTAELDKIDKMTGEEFEKYVISLLYLSGYFYGSVISSTKTTGDFGADIIIECINGEKVCIQCKRFNSNVGIDAVQEVYSSQKHYNATNCAVITNSHFTKAAVDLANDNGVTLIDRKGLAKVIELEISHLDNIINGSQWTNLLNGILNK